MPALSFPSINGITPSWANVRCTAAMLTQPGTPGPLLEVKDIKAINFTSALTLGYQKEGGKKKNRTSGDQEDSMSLLLYHSGFVNMLRVAKAIAPRGGRNRPKISLVVFNFSLQYTVPTVPPVSYEFAMEGCRIVGWDHAGAEGETPNEVNCPVDTMGIYPVIDGEKVTLIGD